MNIVISKHTNTNMYCYLRVVNFEEQSVAATKERDEILQVSFEVLPEIVKGFAVELHLRIFQTGGDYHWYRWDYCPAVLERSQVRTLNLEPSKSARIDQLKTRQILETKSRFNRIVRCKIAAIEFQVLEERKPWT